jgi:hypothetical protein
MEIDQRQKDVCPPGEAGQSGHDGHILVAHGDLREQFRLPSNQRAAVRVSIARIKYTSKEKHFYASRRDHSLWWRSMRRDEAHFF